MRKTRKNIEDDEDLFMLGAGYIYVRQQQNNNNYSNKGRFLIVPTLQKKRKQVIDNL